MEYTIKLVNHKWCSVNSLRSAQKWKSYTLKKEYSNIYNPIINGKNIPLFNDRISIKVIYNSRLDPDNVAGKFFIDALVNCGVIKDDSKKYVKSWIVENDLKLKNNTYIVILSVY